VKYILRYASANGWVEYSDEVKSKLSMFFVYFSSKKQTSETRKILWNSNCSWRFHSEVASDLPEVGTLFVFFLHNVKFLLFFLLKKRKSNSEKCLSTERLFLLPFFFIIKTFNGKLFSKMFYFNFIQETF